MTNAELIRRTADDIRERRERYQRARSWAQASIIATLTAGALFFVGAILHDFGAPVLAYCSWAATLGATIVSFACILEAKQQGAR